MATPIISASDVEKAYDTSVPYAALFAKGAADYREAQQIAEARKERADQRAASFLENMEKTYDVSTGTPYDEIVGNSLQQANMAVMEALKKKRGGLSSVELQSVALPYLTNIRKNQQAARMALQNATLAAEHIAKTNPFIDQDLVKQDLLKYTFRDDMGMVKDRFDPEDVNRRYSQFNEDFSKLSPYVIEDKYDEWKTKHINAVHPLQKRIETDPSKNMSYSVDARDFGIFNPSTGQLEVKSKPVMIDGNKVSVLPELEYGRIFQTPGMQIALKREIDNINSGVSEKPKWWNKVDDNTKIYFAAQNVLKPYVGDITHKGVSAESELQFKREQQARARRADVRSGIEFQYRQQKRGEAEKQLRISEDYFPRAIDKDPKILEKLEMVGIRPKDPKTGKQIEKPLYFKDATTVAGGWIQNNDPQKSISKVLINTKDGSIWEAVWTEDENHTYQPEDYPNILRQISKEAAKTKYMPKLKNREYYQTQFYQGGDQSGINAPTGEPTFPQMQ